MLESCAVTTNDRLADKNAALSRLGLLIEAVTACVAGISNARSVLEALPHSLTDLARVVRIGRVAVVENLRHADGSWSQSLVFHWVAPDSAALPPSPDMLIPRTDSAALRAWIGPLSQGQAVVTKRGSVSEEVRAFMDQLGALTCLMVPIMVAGQVWGRTCFDDCESEHDWAEEEIKLLTLLAQIIGTAITRERYLQALARNDTLTGLANRMSFSDHLHQALAASQRGASAFAVLYLDLDRFKEVNDTFGHHVGDRLLQEVSRRLHDMTREADIVARLGGDEFAIVQTGIDDSTAAGTLAEKLIDIVSAPYVIDGNDMRIGVSIGISLYEPHVGSAEALLMQADQALYRAKHAGRGQYRFHSDEIDHEVREHMTLADDLRRALATRGLEMHYQPQVELASGTIVGMEALVRWNHPTRGLLLPEDFLPIAEKYGIMQQLGRWAMETACCQMAQWRAAGIHVPVVAINVALAQIKMGREFVRDVLDTIKRWGLAAGDIELDVTELVLARSTLAQSNVLDHLRRLGVGIAIDDFGSQYSSLDYLRGYRVNRLKIARGMIAAADAEPGGVSMVRAILGLAAELGIEVVAEGVETDNQRQLLVRSTAHAQGQGFLYSRAVAADQFESMLRAGVVRPEAQEREDGPASAASAVEFRGEHAREGLAEQMR